MKTNNLFQDIPADLPDELLDDLVGTNRMRIERIVSAGHASAEGFWYDQEQSEWVLLVKGNAGLRFEDEDEVVILNPGDWLNIPAHKKHRVEWTDPNEKTIWLAVHY